MQWGTRGAIVPVRLLEAVVFPDQLLAGNDRNTRTRSHVCMTSDRDNQSGHGKAKLFHGDCFVP